MMFWVIQEDLFLRNEREVLISTLEKFDISYQIVKIIPSTHELVPEITQIDNIITNGSVLLSKIAFERGWNPGGFFNNNFDYKVWFPYFKDYLLNKDATFTTVANAFPKTKSVFVRPVLDSKAFDGGVKTHEEFYAWKSKILNNESKYIKPDTEIIYSSPKDIGQEHRHFIVDGKVITSSRYKLGGQVNYSEGADDYIIEFVNKMASIYSPARAFVLDTYITDNEIGIVEIGCIANAGFYKADVQKLVMCLDSMTILSR